MQKSTISDGQGLTVDLLDFGARIDAINFNGHSMALGYENDADFLTDPYYLGATIGPICNRINNGRFIIDEQLFQMPCNLGDHSLHSGDVGFDKETWSLVTASKNSVHYQLIYPLSRVGLEGRLLVDAIYTVENGGLSIDYHCKTDTTTYVNLTNHVYLNIDGSDSIANHQFEIFAENYAEVDQHSIPTGELIPLDVPMKYGIMNSSRAEFSGLCDHHFNTLGGSSEHQDELQTMVVARSELNNIELEISSNSVGFQFYTGKFLSQPFLPSAGFCVEAQLAPDAINQEHFPAPLLEKGDERIQSMLLQFRQTD
jgi:aldose 1-epimerase